MAIDKVYQPVYSQRRHAPEECQMCAYKPALYPKETRAKLYWCGDLRVCHDCGIERIKEWNGMVAPNPV